jgi:hypothetical protein
MREKRTGKGGKKGQKTGQRGFRRVAIVGGRGLKFLPIVNNQ